MEKLEGVQRRAHGRARSLVTGSKHELHLNASPEAVWQEITKQGRNNWYFMLDVDGTFAAGERVVWKAGGDVAEEAEVIEADPPRRLELHSRLLFAPNLAELPPHRLVWEVVTRDGGSLVRCRGRHAAGRQPTTSPKARTSCAGLRLAHRSVGQAEVARLPSIGEIKVRDVTPDRRGRLPRFFRPRRISGLSRRGSRATAWRRIAPDRRGVGGHAPATTTARDMRRGSATAASPRCSHTSTASPSDGATTARPRGSAG